MAACMHAHVLPFAQVYSRLLAYLKDEQRLPAYAAVPAAGMVAGGCLSLVLGPTELIKVSS